MRSFMDTIRIAKLEPSTYSAHEDVDDNADVNGRDFEDLFEDTSDESTGVVSAETLAPQKFSWPLSKGIIAEIRISGGIVTPLHLERLRQYLELAKDAFKDENDLSSLEEE